uniref:Transcription initiation factor TFIID subunit 4 n=1 Tax=Lygus hesperus TaxID=30085 RepID=A0A146M1C1_LYGHE
MASAKFLEEALSTDVDESAVNAIVGSLETQLVSSSPPVSVGSGTSVVGSANHVASGVSNGGRGSSAGGLKHGTIGGVANGGGVTSQMNILINSGDREAKGAEHHNTVGLQSSSYTVNVNQVTSCTSSNINSNITSSVVQTSLSNVNKTEGVKVVYPSGATGVASRVCYSGSGGTLPNGVSTATMANCEVQTTATVPAQFGATQVVATTGSVAKTNTISVQSGMDGSKPTGTALVIKGAVSSSQSVAPVSTMTLTSGAGGNSGVNMASTIANTGVPGPGVVTFTKPMTQAVGTQQTAIVGGSPLSNVQILNVNALRAGTPLQGAKGMPPRAVMINTQQMVGGRPVAPGQITLQTLQGLAPGAQGHLLLKTENGQYQLLRVGPPAAPGTSQQATPVSIAGNNVSTFRVQTIQNASNAGTAVQTQVPALAAQGSSTAPTTIVTQRGAVDQTKEKCRKFLANLLELSSREPKAVERSVRTLIQELVDTKVEPEQFCDRLEKLLNASPQPCLIGFLKKSLPLLRQSMVNNELVIDGIKPPPASVVFSSAPVAATTQTPQVVAAPAVVRPPIQMQTTPQMRVVTPTAVRAGQQIQQRIMTPIRVAAASTQVATVGVNKSTVAAIRTQGTPTIVRPTQIVRTPTGGTIALRPGQTLAKTQFSTRPVLAATTQFNQPVKSSVFVTKPPLAASTIKDSREKKTFSSSSAGYIGDDDINDVAAMGGVNLAEESQRILGSTEFVGTQIRSCKDDIFLHSGPLMNKIAHIAHKHGLDEPSSDIATLISHATQERLKDLVEKLAVIAEHRMDFNKADPRYEVTQDVRAQLKCLEEVDKAERKRHEEQERELLLRAAKSRTKPEDPEQAKLKAKAKEMQRAEMEELRQREANLTALLAIGPRKKPKMDESVGSPSAAGTSTSTPPMTLRPRVKRVCMRDLLTMMEQEKETCRSLLLYKSYFK